MSKVQVIDGNKLYLEVTLVEQETGKTYTEKNPLGTYLTEDDGGTAGLDQAYYNAGREHYDDPESGFSFEITEEKYTLEDE